LQALLVVSSHYGRSVGAEAIRAGLPLVDGALTADLFPRAAGRANLEAVAQARALPDIPALVLPAVLVLIDGIAVLKAIDQEAGRAQIVDCSDPDARLEDIPLALLQARYSGLAFFVRPKPLAAGRREVLKDLAGAHWFWSVVGKFRSNYVHIGLSAFLINMLALVFPLFVMAVYDRVLPNYAVSSLVALAIGVALSFVFDVALRIARSRMIDLTGKQADVVLASNIFEHVLGLKMRARPNSVGVLANQIRDFDSVREFFTSSSLISLTDLLFAVLFVAIMFLIVGPLAWIPVLLLPVIIGIGLLIQRPLERAMKELQAEAAARHGVLVESIASLETVKVLGAEGRMQSVWERSVAASARSGEAVHYWSSLALTLSNAAQQVAQLVLIVVGVFLVMNNTISVGGLVAANMLIGRILSPLTNIAAMMTRGAQTSQSLQAIDRIMALDTERPKDRVFVARQVAKGSISFQNVSFSYPGTKTKALDRVSFTINPGERVGIVGRIGSGKTTVGRLLSALYEPDEGQVLVDGVDLRQYDPADIRSGIGIVLQDVQLFFGTVRENIVVGRPASTDAEVVEAGRLAGVEDFIGQHPDGYDMAVAEGGRSLSGGQRQSVALARVLIRNPKILFMDEPTSALDMSSESEFCARLNTVLGRDSTFVVSTHRVSLLRFVDRLIVFEHGRIIADGPRDRILTELAKSNRGQQGGAAHAGN
jgi:ATP-binding cassette subfamily C protein LapB